MRPFRPLFLDDVNRWLDRAEQMLRNAEAMPTPEGRRACLVIAEQYQTIANQAQNRADTRERLDRLTPATPQPLFPGAGSAAPAGLPRPSAAADQPRRDGLGTPFSQD